MTSDELRQK